MASCSQLQFETKDAPCDERPQSDTNEGKPQAAKVSPVLRDVFLTATWIHGALLALFLPHTSRHSPESHTLTRCCCCCCCCSHTVAELKPHSPHTGSEYCHHSPLPDVLSSEPVCWERGGQSTRCQCCTFLLLHDNLFHVRCRSEFDFEGSKVKKFGKQTLQQSVGLRNTGAHVHCGHKAPRDAVENKIVCVCVCVHVQWR